MKKIIANKNILYVACLTLLCSCSSKNKESETENATIHKDFVQSVETATITKGPQEKKLMLTGTVTYDMDNVVNYIALSNGMVEKSNISLGQKVSKDQVLLEIKSSELNSLQSELTAADGELKIAQREYDASKDLYDDNMISHKEFLEAESKLRQAKAETDKLKKDINLYGGKNTNGLYAVKSPISGYIVEKEVGGRGSIISEGDRLFTIADLTGVWVSANIYAGNLGTVEEGMPVDVVSISYPNEIFKGKIDAISPIFDPEEKVVKARIKLDNPKLKLKPDMSVSVIVEDMHDRGTLGLPSKALVFDDNKYYVVIEESEGHYRMEQVTPISHNQNTTYIEGNIKAGEKVVIKNQLLIFNQLKSQLKDA